MWRIAAEFDPRSPVMFITSNTLDEGELRESFAQRFPHDNAGVRKWVRVRVGFKQDVDQSGVAVINYAFRFLVNPRALFGQWQVETRPKLFVPAGGIHEWKVILETWVRRLRKRSESLAI